MVAVAMAVGSLTGAANVASAADPVIATPVAYGAPDGVFLTWTSPDDTIWLWRVTRTVDGVVTTKEVSYSQNYADYDLAPGQSVTYTVAAESGTGTTYPDSAPVTATRDTKAWTAPDGAQTTELTGRESPSPTDSAGYSPAERPITMYLGSQQGMTDAEAGSDSLSFGRLPGRGTYPLSSAPGSGQISFSSLSCLNQTGTTTGQVAVTDVVYSASGVPLQLGAEFSWSCGGDTTVVHASVRYRSATALAHVVVEAPTALATFIRGSSIVQTWTLRNIGTGPASLGNAVGKGWGVSAQASTGCDGMTLQPAQTCPVDLTVAADSSARPGRQNIQLVMPVTGQMMTSADSTVTVYRELGVPTVKVVGTSAVALSIQATLQNSDQMQPLTGLVIERQVGDSAWTTMATLQPGDIWTDTDVSVGQNISYRATTVAQEGERTAASDPATTTVPGTTLMWTYSGHLYGSGFADTSTTVPPQVEYHPAVAREVTDVAVSPDRQHLALTSDDTTAGRMALTLTDLAGQHPRTLLSFGPVTDPDMSHPLFSPDGKHIAVAFCCNAYPKTYDVGIVDVASGTMHMLDTARGIPYGWSPDGSALLMRLGDPSASTTLGVDWVRLSDEHLTAVPGTAASTNDLNGEFKSVTVSRAGEIAWTSTTTDGSSALFLVPPGGGTPRVVWQPPHCTLANPRFSPTGSSIAVQVRGYGNATSCETGVEAIVEIPHPDTWVPTDGWTRLSTDPVYYPHPMEWLVTQSAPPTVAVSVPALTGPAAAVHLDGSDPDDAVGALSYSCQLDGGAWSPCAATWSLSGLAAGTHTVTAVAIDPARGRSQPATASWKVDSTAPSVTLATVPAQLLGSALNLRWSATDTGGSTVASYDVRERYAAPSGGFTGYVYPSSWQRRSATSLPLTLAGGYTYCFSVRARDALGNTSAFTPERCVTTLLDDRAFAVHGATRGTSAAYVFGTSTRAAGTATALSRSGVNARRLGLLVATCSTCGFVDVWIGSYHWGRLSTHSTTTRYKQVLWLPWSASRSGALVLRPASGAPVYVDGAFIEK